MAIAQPQQKSGRSGMPYTILGGVLAVIGFGAVLLFANLGGSHGTTSSGGGAQVDVLVATQDIGIRTPITSSVLTVRKFAASDAPTGLGMAAITPRSALPLIAGGALAGAAVTPLAVAALRRWGGAGEVLPQWQ